MKDERKRILQLVENGTISAQQAIGLLERLEEESKNGDTSTKTTVVAENNQATKEQEIKEKDSKDQAENESTQSFEEEDKGASQQSNTNREEEFIDDLKKDFAKFSSRFMDFIGSTVTKVKDMDFSTMSPTGKAVQWKKELDNTNFSNITVDMPNGQLTIRDSADGTAYLEITATPMLQFTSSRDISEEDMKEQFTALVDAGTLRIHNAAKMIKTDVIAYVPKGEYMKVRANLFNGNFTMHSLSVNQLRVETKNGGINLSDLTFDSAELESANGSIEIRDVAGREVEAETINGRVYIDGSLRAVEAKSVNGNVILTTKSQQAERIKAHTIAGTIELYIPTQVALIGEVSSAFGKMDIDLSDVELLHETSQVFNKSVRFRKEVADAQKLTIDGETKTGSVIIRYTL
ncbi:MAG: DUF4097 family beta strand repeat protein [Kurthia sp.]|nr:DUF4097 family beta strand repeat protein [Candidatus Kurthia equi]